MEIFQLHQEFELERIERCFSDNHPGIKMSALFAKARCKDTYKRLTKVLNKYPELQVNIFIDEEETEYFTEEQALEGLRHVISLDNPDQEIAVAILYQGLQVLYIAENFASQETTSS